SAGSRPRAGGLVAELPTDRRNSATRGVRSNTQVGHFRFFSRNPNPREGSSRTLKTMGMAMPAAPYPGGFAPDPLAPLMVRVGAGDEGALAALYDATSHRVYGLAFRVLRVREDAEEVTLDVYTQVWRGRTQYDPDRGSVLKFLLMLARTRAVDLLRSRARRSQVEERVE